MRDKPYTQDELVKLQARDGDSTPWYTKDEHIRDLQARNTELVLENRRLRVEVQRRHPRIIVGVDLAAGPDYSVVIDGEGGCRILREPDKT